MNEIGHIVREQWLWLGKQYSHVKLDAWIIMPNHVHGIMVMNNDEWNGHVENGRVGNGRDRSLPKIKTISSLIGAFKTTSSKQIHEIGVGEFQWQKSFYDHIIRDETALQKIREYIAMNPAKWDIDRNNLKNCWK